MYRIVSTEQAFKAQIIVGTTQVLYKASAHLELEAKRSGVIQEAFTAVDTSETGFVASAAVSGIVASLSLEGDVSGAVEEFAEEDGRISFDSFCQLVDSMQ